MAYNFLHLNLLYMLPAIYLWIKRPDLRRYGYIQALAGLPFALTEPLFYPSYWKPTFLLDLGEKVGFGIEDFHFVATLGFVTATLFPYVFKKKLIDSQTIPLSQKFKFLPTIAIVTALSIIFKVHAIYYAPILMGALTIQIASKRGDLVAPAVMGIFLNTILYWLICRALDLIHPGIFNDVWNLTEFSNIFIFGVPLEELLYMGASGAVGSIFLPYLLNRSYADI